MKTQIAAIIAVLLMTLTVSGCATTAQVEILKGEVASLKKRVEKLEGPKFRALPLPTEWEEEPKIRTLPPISEEIEVPVVRPRRRIKVIKVDLDD